MSDLSDVSSELKKYTEFTTTLKFFDGKKKKRTLEKECTFSLCYDYSAIEKIAVKYGDYIEGLKKLDEAKEAITSRRLTPETLECIKTFALAGDSCPMIGDDYETIGADDIGTIEFEEIGTLLVAIYVALDESFKKKARMKKAAEIAGGA